MFRPIAEAPRRALNFFAYKKSGKSWCSFDIRIIFVLVFVNHTSLNN